MRMKYINIINNVECFSATHTATCALAEFVNVIDKNIRSVHHNSQNSKDARTLPDKLLSDATGIPSAGESSASADICLVQPATSTGDHSGAENSTRVSSGDSVAVSGSSTEKIKKRKRPMTRVDNQKFHNVLKKLQIEEFTQYMKNIHKGKNQRMHTESSFRSYISNFRRIAREELAAGRELDQIDFIDDTMSSRLIARIGAYDDENKHKYRNAFYKYLAFLEYKRGYKEMFLNLFGDE